MFRQFLLFAILLFVTIQASSQIPPIETGVPQTLAKWRAGNYSDVRYKLNLTLEKMSPILKGTIEVSLKTGADQIILDWRKIRGKEDLSKVENVSVNGKAAKFEEINEHLVFKENVIKGENIIKLDFSSPIASSGAAITRYVDKEDGAEYVYSLFVPSDASTAFPVFDQPDLKARFSLTLSMPDKWKAVSNSNSIGKMFSIETDRGRINFNVVSFAETKPISTYVFAFAAGEFETFRKIDDTVSTSRDEIRESEIRKLPLRNAGAEYSYIYVRKSQVEKFKPHAAETFRLNREAVKYLESYFDYKFPFPKYDLVLIPEFPFGGMEHAGATFLRESSVIFPSEPTANDFVSRANLIFHEAAHQWFGDTVTMKWFDDLWLKEGFAEFMAYKTLEKVLPEYNAWKIFYERNKQAAYLTDSTKGTTPIYQEIPNLASAKSAYGNIVYRKAPSFLRQAEFYLGADKFQTAVRAFLKKHEFANAEWTDLVKEFETSSKLDLKDWANSWVTKRGLSIISFYEGKDDKSFPRAIHNKYLYPYSQKNALDENNIWNMRTKILVILKNGSRKIVNSNFSFSKTYDELEATTDVLHIPVGWDVEFKFLNYQDYGYGIFLLDERSRDYVLKNIQNEQDDFLRSMMWGTLWDSVRETELAPADYVTLAIKNIATEKDELTINTILGRVSTAMNYYLPDAKSKEFAAQLETLLLDKMQNAPMLGQRITFYRAFLNVASSEKARNVLKQILQGNSIEKARKPSAAVIAIYGNQNAIVNIPIKTKDKFDIAAKLLILSDRDAANLLAELEKTETSDEAKRYAYAARAGIATAENKQKYFADFTGNKEISESYIESAFAPFNSTKHADLTLPFLENALKELPNLKRNRKIFFVNGWLSAFIGGQKSEQALAIVNKFLTDNPNLDKDLRLKVLEVADNLERSVKIKKKFAK